MRRAHDALKGDAYVEDKSTGELHRPHHIDLKTGMYRGRQVMKVKDASRAVPSVERRVRRRTVGGHGVPAMDHLHAKFSIGSIVRHRMYPSVAS